MSIYGYSVIPDINIQLFSAVGNYTNQTGTYTYSFDESVSADWLLCNLNTKVGASPKSNNGEGYISTRFFDGNEQPVTLSNYIHCYGASSTTRKVYVNSTMMLIPLFSNNGRKSFQIKNIVESNAYIRTTTVGDGITHNFNNCYLINSTQFNVIPPNFSASWNESTVNLNVGQTSNLLVKNTLGDGVTERTYLLNGQLNVPKAQSARYYNGLFNITVGGELVGTLNMQRDGRLGSNASYYENLNISYSTTFTTNKSFNSVTLSSIKKETDMSNTTMLQWQTYCYEIPTVYKYTSASDTPLTFDTQTSGYQYLSAYGV